MERDILLKLLSKIKKVGTALGVMNSKIDSGAIKEKTITATTSSVNLYTENIDPNKFISAVVTGGDANNGVYAIPYTYNSNLILRLFVLNSDSLLEKATDAERSIKVLYY